MLLSAVAKTFLLTLLAFFVFPLDRYLNHSAHYCGFAMALGDHESEPALSLSVQPLRAERSKQAPSDNTTGATATAIFMKRQAPQLLQIREPSALWIAVNIRECRLLRGDVLEIRGNRVGNRTAIRITPENASLATSAWKNVTSFWNHPIVVQGSAATVEYRASMRTLMLPMPKQAHERPVVAIDSYTFAYPVFTGSSGSGATEGSSSMDTSKPPRNGTVAAVAESIVGSSSEMKQAVCFKKSAPRVYEKARSVARLLIRRPNRDDPLASLPATSMLSRTTVMKATGSAVRGGREIPYPTTAPRANAGYYCTGWLVGRGNHLMTNYHCLADLPVSSTGGVIIQQHGDGNEGKEGLSVLGRLRGWLRGYSSSKSSSVSAPGSSPSSTTGSSPSDVSTDEEIRSATIDFMAETKSCRESGTLGERPGVIEATSATVVAANPALDYLLLRVEPNDTSADLARKYGYLQLRATGPEDGETIYIPQHPNGEPKEIATTKNGRAAVIRVFLTPQSSSASGASDLALSGSTTSSSAANATSSDLFPVNPNVFYNADTLPGSSGSPVLSQKDNAVIALHHAGGTAPASFRALSDANGDNLGDSSGSGDSQNLVDFNSGVRIDLIIDDLRKKSAIPPCALAQECAKQSKDPCCKTKW